LWRPVLDLQRAPNTSSLDPAKSGPQPKRRLNRFSRFCRAHDRDRPTDRQTDRRTNHTSLSVTRGRVYETAYVVVLCSQTVTRQSHRADFAPGVQFTTIVWKLLTTCHMVHSGKSSYRILWARVQPTLDPYAEAFYSRPTALTQEGRSLV